MKPAFSALTICGLEELEAHAARDVTHVLSIIDPGRDEPDVFRRYGAIQRTTLRFHDAIEPGPGLILPTVSDVEAILAWGRVAYARGAVGGGDERTGADAMVDGHMLVHCHMGISRSTAAMTILLAQAHPDESEVSITERVRAIRPIAWPNLLMIGFADEILGRSGRLTASVGSLYARSLAAKPDLADVMTRLDRGREVELGRAIADGRAMTSRA